MNEVVIADDCIKWDRSRRLFTAGGFFASSAEHLASDLSLTLFIFAENQSSPSHCAHGDSGPSFQPIGKCETGTNPLQL